jgi:ABC-type taurine transport system substrate-binding protein
VEVVLLECETGPDALAAILHGEADVATAADVPIAMRLFEQPDFAIVTTFTTTDVIARIITRTDTGIAQAADLRGKTIATAKGTASHFTLSSALLSDGLSLADVEIVEAKPMAMLEMLGDRSVDAIAVCESYATKAQERLREAAVVLPDSGLYRASFNLVIRSAYAAQHPEIVRRVVQALAYRIPLWNLHDGRLSLHTVLDKLSHVIELNTLAAAFNDMAGELVTFYTQLEQQVNALKFCHASSPEIHLGAEHTAKEWVFAIRDNGIGIEPQYFERIFQMFQRLHTRQEYAGSGIGLALCKKIVERYGGRIWVTSQVGQGTAFFFTIPDRR